MVSVKCAMSRLIWMRFSATWPAIEAIDRRDDGSIVTAVGTLFDGDAYLTVMPPTMPFQSWSAQRRS